MIKQLPPLQKQGSLDLLDMDKNLKTLTHVFNLSQCQGIMPSDFKTARITPISGDKNDPNNIRLISVI